MSNVPASPPKTLEEFYKAMEPTTGHNPFTQIGFALTLCGLAPWEKKPEERIRAFLAQVAHLGKAIWNRGLAQGGEQYPNASNCIELALQADKLLLEMHIAAEKLPDSLRQAHKIADILQAERNKLERELARVTEELEDAKKTSQSHYERASALTKDHTQHRQRIDEALGISPEERRSGLEGAITVLISKYKALKTECERLKQPGTVGFIAPDYVQKLIATARTESWRSGRDAAEQKINELIKHCSELGEGGYHKRNALQTARAMIISLNAPTEGSS